jgi:hypothetical protein
MKAKAIFSPLLAALMFCSFPVLAADSSLSQQLVHIAFSETERQVMERYFDGQIGERQESGKKHKHKSAKGGKGKKGLPPGLAKKGSLPPGLAKRETLPPGLSRQPLPTELDSRLPPLREGLERVIIDGSVVLIEQATGTVLDILEHIATGNR